MAMVMASESSGSPSSAGSAVGSKPLCPTGTHPKVHALFSSWIQRLRPLSAAAAATFYPIQAGFASLGEPTSPPLGSGKMRVGEQTPKGRNSPCGSESVGSQNVVRGSDHLAASPLLHCPPTPILGFDPSLGCAMAANLGAFPAYGKFFFKPSNHIEFNPSEQLGFRRPGCSLHSGAYGNPLLRFSSGVERSPCPPCELTMAAQNFRPCGQNCSRFDHLPMLGKAPLSKDPPLVINGCLPFQNDLPLKRVLKAPENAHSCGVNTYPANQNPTTDFSRLKRAEELASQANSASVIFTGSIEKKQGHNSGLERVAPHHTQGDQVLSLGDFPINDHSIQLEKKAGFAKPPTFSKQVLGSDKQSIDQAYVLTPIFTKSHSFLQSKIEKSFTEVVQRERVVSVPLPTTRPFFSAGGAKTISKYRTQNSASASPYSNCEDSGPSKGLGFKMTSLKSAQRRLTQTTSDSITASLSKEFVGDIYKRAFSFDQGQHSEDSCPSKDVGKP